MRLRSLPFVLLTAFALAAPLHSRAAAADPPDAASTPSVAEAVGKVQSFYDKTSTFSSEFQQEFVAKAYNKRIVSHGQVVFAKPGKMDWVYEDPKGNRVVSDGAQIYSYTPNNNQVVQAKIDKSQYPAALSFLTGQGKLADQFTFELKSGAEMGFPGGYVLIGKPKVAHPAVDKVLFYVDAATSQVRRVMIIDPQGNRNRFTFVSPRVNEPVSPSRFKFVIPPGTTVVHP